MVEQIEVAFRPRLVMYCVPGTMPLSYVVLSTLLREKYYGFADFANEKMENKKGNNLLESPCW